VQCLRFQSSEGLLWNFKIKLCLCKIGTHGSIGVEALYYKPEGRSRVRYPMSCLNNVSVE
jgi:hypothetical protein